MCAVSPTYTAFADCLRHIHTGTDLVDVVERGRAAYDSGGVQTVWIFDDATGERAEVDPREGIFPWPERAAPPKAGPGRPKLGVVSREVSLLPRHWDWLATQPGGASAALRRLVDEARKDNAGADAVRVAKEAAYRFMSVVGGDRPNFEEASRALFAGRFAEVAEMTASWPADLRNHLRRLLDRAAAVASPPPLAP
jgi:hypothetical protein